MLWGILESGTGISRGKEASFREERKKSGGEGGAAGTEIGETAEVEDVQTVNGTEIERVHEGRGFGKFKRSAFGEDGTDELGTEILIRGIVRDTQPAQEQSEEVIMIVFPALEHIINKSLCAEVNFIRHVYLQEGAGDIALSAVESAVEMFFHQSGGKRYGGIFPCEAVEYGQIRIECKGNMGKRFACEQPDEP